MRPAWDAADYAANSSMQLTLAADFLYRIAIDPIARVLDVGCGDGRVTALIGATDVTGVDASAAMIDAARMRSPTGRFVVADARELPFEAMFDVAVSCTALHWITEGHADALASIRRALVRGGRFCATFPGAGNMAALTAAALDVCARPGWHGYFDGFDFPWFFPTTEVYEPLLTDAGFVIDRLELVPRDVTHAGIAGLSGWIRTTWMPYTERLPAASRQGWIDEVAGRYAAVAPPGDDGLVHVPSYRLEIEGHRP